LFILIQAKMATFVNSLTENEGGMQKCKTLRKDPSANDICTAGRRVQ